MTIEYTRAYIEALEAENKQLREDRKQSNAVNAGLAQVIRQSGVLNVNEQMEARLKLLEAREKQHEANDTKNTTTIRKIPIGGVLLVIASFALGVLLTHKKIIKIG